jgi:8-oxo-dGTP pyrophosphatase MutT (NUDIX family)
MENPWKTLETKDIYDNSWINIREDQVINPSGGKGIYGVVHFKNKALGIVPVDDDGNTWLVGQYRYALNEYSWEIPEGGGPLEDDLLTSAQRELQEETGFTATSWTKLCRLHTSNSVTDEEGFIYLAEGLQPGPAKPEETEELEIRKLPISDAVAMIFKGEITDAISIIGLLAAERELAKRD